MNNIVFCLIGPTAAGKTALAEQLYQTLPVEIISVDSALIYRGMDIGTAKPTSIELMRTPHHLVNIRDPYDTYSVKEFCDDASRLCCEIIARQRIPLLVGGTMLYFNAIQEGLSDLPEACPSIRQALQEELQQQGLTYLYAKLQAVDPTAAARIHPHDSQRIQRALEVYLLTGRPLSEHFKHKQCTDLLFVNLLLIPKQRQWLHDRIAKRFGHMIQSGLIEEVEGLIAQWHLNTTFPAMRAVGYRQVYDYLQGTLVYDELLPKGIAATRQLAKRQLTWLRHWKDGYIIECDQDHDHMLQMVHKIIKESYNA